MKRSVVWLLPAVIFVFVLAVFASFVLKRNSGGDTAPTITQQIEQPQAAPVPKINDLSTKVADSKVTTTNLAEADAEEDRVVALITEGNELFGRGNYAEAARKYDQAVTISPDQEDLHYNLGIALAKLGKTEEAKKHYREALSIYPEYAEAHNNLGNLLMRENNLEEAIEHFREAIKNASDNASFHNNLGTAFGRQGKVAEAITQFEAAIEHSPDYVEARVNLANAFITTGRVEEAITQINEALRLRPDFGPALQAMQRARQRREASAPEK